jgi:FixJ family two-component response regulator
MGRRARGREFEEQHTGVRSLSQTERRIVRLIATDKTSKQIAEETAATADRMNAEQFRSFSCSACSVFSVVHLLSVFIRG